MNLTMIMGSIYLTHHYDHGHNTLTSEYLSQNELLRDLKFLDNLKYYV